MTRSHHRIPEVISGPYGTLMEEHARKLRMPELAQPDIVLDAVRAPIWKKLVSDAMHQYADRGATIVATPTYSARKLLTDGNDQRFREVMRATLDFVSGVMAEIRQTRQSIASIVSLGTRGHAYKPDEAPRTNQESYEYHARQVEPVRESNANFLLFEAVNTITEAVGMALASREFHAPCIVSFVLNESGQLKSGESLADAIRIVDNASDGYPLGYSINCCSMSAIRAGLRELARTAPQSIQRLKGIYPNPSSNDHEELCGADAVHRDAHFDEEIPELITLAQRHKLLFIGGCCGTTPTDTRAFAQAACARNFD